MIDPYDFAPAMAHPDGRVLPLAFAYGGVAFYYDLSEFRDELTTIERVNGNTIYGIAASNDLIEAIHRYGAERGDVHIARFFNDCVANELEEA